MMIICGKCGARFESLIITRERAVAEVSKQITQHWTIKHKDEMLSIGKGIMEAQMAFAWYTTMSTLAFIPKNEEYLLEQMEKSLDITMKAIGYDEPDEEGDENEEGEEGEEEEDGEEVLPPDLSSQESPSTQTEVPIESNLKAMPLRTS